LIEGLVRPMPALTDEARAKVNLTLRVNGRRVDGYHDLESVVAFCDCADVLTLNSGTELNLATTGPRAPDCGEASDNLVLKAAQLLSRARAGFAPRQVQHSTRCCRSQPASARIGGCLPRRCGCWRGRTARIGRSAPDRSRATDRADVPVCLSSRPCVMTGVGETLLPLSLPTMPCVLVNPCVPVATKDVFAELGLRHGELLVGADRCDPA